MKGEKTRTRYLVLSKKIRDTGYVIRDTEKSSGFTLVELLVVMAIISILATVILGGFRSSQRRSRDTARKSDLKQISSALEMFYSDYERYPASSSGGAIQGCPFNGTSGDSCTWGVADDTSKFTDGETDYFQQLPADPVSSQNYYYRTLRNNQAYQLYAHLENSEDMGCIGGDCSTDNIGLSCGTGGANCNFAITSPNTTPLEIPTLQLPPGP